MSDGQIRDGRMVGLSMTHEEIISDYPELAEEDIRACLAFAADKRLVRIRPEGETTR